jgi:hypothetical protein
MAKITECVIDVELANAIRKMADALALKVPDGKLGFRCPKCGLPVKSMMPGKTAAHFEHLKRNNDCSLSHVRRPNGR